MYVFVGKLSLDYFHQLHHGNRIEEMHADDPFRMPGNSGHLRDGQGRRVGSQYGIGTANGLQLLEDSELDVHVFGNGLDEQIMLLAILIVQRCGDAPHGFLFAGLFHLAFFDQTVQTLFYRLHGAIHRVVRTAFHQYVITCLGKGLNDTMSHGARSDNANFHFICFSD